MQTLGYPLTMPDRIPEITEARNIELGLGLQLCFLHRSKYKFEHPRFCFGRLEYVGQKIQDLVMAVKLLMKHPDAPGSQMLDASCLSGFKMLLSTVEDLEIQLLLVFNKPFMDFHTPSMGSQMLDSSCLRFLTSSKTNQKLFEILNRLIFFFFFDR